MKTSYENALKAMNNTSTSFCAAKWYNVSIWLGNGRTASCHHPLAHKIPDQELAKDASALHNTEFKKKQRKMMHQEVTEKEYIVIEYIRLLGILMKK